MFMGMLPADGKRLSMTGQDFYRMANGKIAEIWHVGTSPASWVSSASRLRHPTTSHPG
jgi:hypothetical protein